MDGIIISEVNEYHWTQNKAHKVSCPTKCLVYMVGPLGSWSRWWFLNHSWVIKLSGSSKRGIDNVFSCSAGIRASGTGPAEPVITGPTFAGWCLRSEQMWSQRSYGNFQTFFTLCSTILYNYNDIICRPSIHTPPLLFRCASNLVCLLLKLRRLKLVSLFPRPNVATHTFRLIKTSN